MSPSSIAQLALHKATDYLRAQSGVVAAFAFGSVLTSDFRTESDIDIALLMRERLSAEELIELREAVSAACGCKIDLVPLNSEASTVLQNEVATKGLLLFSHDEDASLKFLIKAPQMYLDLMMTWGPVEQS